MANDDLKTLPDAGKSAEIGRADRRYARRTGLNGDDAIEVAALSGRDAAELERPSHRLATAWNQMET